MARIVTAGNSISLGSDASIDDFTTRSMFYFENASPAAGESASQVGKSAGWLQDPIRGAIGETNHHIHLIQQFSTVDGQWVTANNTITNGTDTAVGSVYNRSAAGNAPTFYINGASSATTTSVPAVGTSVADAASNLQFDGTTNGFLVGWFIYDDIAFTAAQANLHKNWGYVGTFVSVWHPMWTEATENKGTATADMTISGAPVNEMNKVPRPGCGGPW